MQKPGHHKKTVTYAEGAAATVKVVDSGGRPRFSYTFYTRRGGAASLWRLDAEPAQGIVRQLAVDLVPVGAGLLERDLVTP